MNQRNETLPRAREGQEIVVKELPDEVLVYDLKRHKAHCLNRTSALVWRHCDGKTTVRAMADRLAAEGLPADESIVRLALEQLQGVQLLAEPPPALDAVPRMSRRTLFRKVALLGGAAIALPIIQSIVAPSVAAAATCVTAQTCQQTGAVGSPCCSGGTCQDLFPPNGLFGCA